MNIYEPAIWQKMLKKYPNLQRLATENGVVDYPEKAKELKYSFFRNISRNKSSKEKDLCLYLSQIEFFEQTLS